MKNVLAGSIILIIGLFLSVYWEKFKDNGDTYTFPFRDDVDGIYNSKHSWSPEVYRTVFTWEIMPYFVEAFLPILYIYCFMLLGRMPLRIWGIVVDVWWFYIVFQAIKLADHMLSDRLLHFRYYFIIGIGAIQIYYIAYYKRENK